MLTRGEDHSQKDQETQWGGPGRGDVRHPSRRLRVEPQELAHKVLPVGQKLYPQRVREPPRGLRLPSANPDRIGSIPE